MGITPLSTAIKMRGKLVSGKTEIGIVNARYTPRMASVTMRKMTLCEWRENQYDSPLFTPALFLIFVLFGSRLFAGRFVRPLFFGLLSLLGGHLGVVRQAISTGSNHLLVALQAVHDLHVVTLLDACLHSLLLCAVIGANHHHGCSYIRSSNDGSVRH